MSKEVFVKCNVYEGMFSDEAVVELPRKTGENMFIVPKSAVQGGPASAGKVKARLLTRGQEQWVVLPTDYRETVSLVEAELA